MLNCEAGRGSTVSEDVRRAAGIARAAAGEIGSGVEQEGIAQEDLSALLTAAAQLYASCSADPYSDGALAGLKMTATEACTVAAAVLRAQSLTPFEFSIWFSSGRVGRPDQMAQIDDEE